MYVSIYSFKEKCIGVLDIDSIDVRRSLAGNRNAEFHFPSGSAFKEAKKAEEDHFNTKRIILRYQHVRIGMPESPMIVALSALDGATDTLLINGIFKGAKNYYHGAELRAIFELITKE